MSGCASHQVADLNVQKTFTYDWKFDDQSKTELWVKARNHFAQSFGNSNSVIRVLDRDSAMILGKAGVKWTLSGFGSCYSEYNLKFQAKDGKARLQYELLYGAAPYSECTGWPWPIVTGYEEVKTEFNDSAQKLEDYLRSEDSFSDF